jgi:hypothetical protein
MAACNHEVVTILLLDDLMTGKQVAGPGMALSTGCLSPCVPGMRVHDCLSRAPYAPVGHVSEPCG